MGKTSKIAKAKGVAKQIAAPTAKATHKIRTKLHFYRPRTNRVASKPTIIHSISKEIAKKNPTNLNYASVLISPIPSDKNIQRMENDNTITFNVANWANKGQIKEAFVTAFKVPVRKVNTLNTPLGKKKAYIRLANDQDALNIASKIGLL